MKGLSWVLSKQTFQGCFPKKPLNTISWLVTDLYFVFLSFTGCRFCFRICSITGKNYLFFFILPTLQGKTDLSTMWRLTHVIAPSKGIQGSLGSCIIPQREFGFQIFHGLCWWNVDSEFQTSVGFRIPWAVFQIPKARISHSRSKNFLDFGIRNSFTWGKH